VLTAHERLTAPEVVIHPQRCRCSCTQCRRALWLRPRTSQTHLQSAAPASAPDEHSLRARPIRSSRRSMPDKGPCRQLKSHR
jgi:hypothetical protein